MPQRCSLLVNSRVLHSAYAVTPLACKVAAVAERNADIHPLSVAFRSQVCVQNSRECREVLVSNTRGKNLNCFDFGSVGLGKHVA